MKLSPVLLAGVLTFGISSLEAVQDPIRDLRAALGGDAALGAIERLRVKSTVMSELRGKGDVETFVVLPDRFLRNSHFVAQRSSVATPDKPYPQLTVGFENMTVEYFDTTRSDGFVGSTPLQSGVPVPGWWSEESRESSLVAGRAAFAQLILPLFGSAFSVTSTHPTTGAIVFQDLDSTAWTLKLGASSLPESMTIARQKIKTGDTRMTLAHLPVITFSDYRPVTGGVTWPHRIVMTIDGKKHEDVMIKSYEINGKMPKALLK
jgi:hypothetical protein